MKLTKIDITGFRSVKGRESVRLDERVTVLIGANDHGKSNIIEAIRCLNEDRVITPDDANWDLAPGIEPSIEWHFRIDDEEMAQLGKIQTSDPTPAAEMVLLGKNKTGEVVFERKGVGTPLQVKSLPLELSTTAAPQVLAMRPRIELFSDSGTTLQDSTSPEEIQSDLVMQGIFRLAGIWDKVPAIFSQGSATTKQLDAASDRLSEALNDHWNQGKDLKWKLRHNSGRIEIEISDPSIDARYSKPSLRSAGFKTYFLLSMVTLAKTPSGRSGKYLFLFDEPGTYLHPHAQIDLQRSFERIADTSQVVYSTHSLFLISKNHPARNKVVSKGKDGTRIDQKPFLKNWKSVRESLGILFSSNFLIADKTLLVEGPSDVVYMLLAIKALKAAGTVDIDLNDLSIVDAGTSEDYVAVAKVMLAEGRSVVALLDGDKSGKSTKARLEKMCAAEIKTRRLTFQMLPDDKSIEDVFADIGILRKAAVETAENLVKQGVRKLAEGVELTAAAAKIKPNPNETLGYVFDQETKTWFEEKDKLSKLSVALQYESSVVEKLPAASNPARQVIASIKEALALRGEKSVEEGVFSEA